MKLTIRQEREKALEFYRHRVREIEAELGQQSPLEQTVEDLQSMTAENLELRGQVHALRGGDHARALAMMAWFASRGATNAGQFPGDPIADAKQQRQAREDFDKWWGPKP